jgi:UDPglucose--hexose-1-phosphate uridylyltransferase
MSDIRYNLLDDRYVIIAPERLHRPEYLTWSREIHAKKACPFCEGNESMTPPEIDAIRANGSKADKKGWQARVVPNLYKAVQIEAPNTSYAKGLYETYEGFGAHEVIIDTPKHFTSMKEWEKETFFYWLKIMQKRVADLRQDHRLVFISLFKNHGVHAGATQEHPHTQLIGLPVVPPETLRYYQRLHHYYHTHGKSLFDDIISQELHDQERIVIENDDFIAFCPYASAYPFEVMITAKENIGSIEFVQEKYLNTLSMFLKELMFLMYGQLGDFDFNMSLCVPPLQRIAQTESFFDDLGAISRFTIRITPRIYKHGGFEISTGMMINPVSPEESAMFLKENDRGNF